METITPFIAPKTIGISFGESASVLDLCTTMTFRIGCFILSTGKEEWGAEPNKHYFVIKLGERIE